MENDNKTKVNNILSDLIEILTVYGTVLKVGEKWNGKKHNIRFNKEIESINKNLIVRLQYNSFDIMFKINNYYVVGGCINSCYGDGILQDGFFNFGNFKQRVMSQKENILKNIKEIKEQMNKVESLQKRKEKIKKELEEHNSNINYYINDIYNLKIK